MITILHGQNIHASRQFLNNLLEESRKGGKQILRLEKNDQTVEIASQFLGGTDLFGKTNTLVLENYLKLKSGKKPDSFHEYLTKSNSEIILWEDGERSSSALASFPGTKILEFKVPSSVFKFLDSLKPENPKANIESFHQALVGTAPEMVFSLISRRFVDLLSPPSKAAPWQQQRLATQSKLFSKEKLSWAVKDLLAIDLAQKTSSSPLTLKSQLELFLLNL